MVAELLSLSWVSIYYIILYYFPQCLKVNELAKYADRQVYLLPEFAPQQSCPKADNHPLVQ